MVKQRVSVSCRYKPLDIIKHTRVYDTIDVVLQPITSLDVFSAVLN